MGHQLIFVVESNKQCKSDWIYIKETINRFYSFDQAHVKLTTIYMDSKTKYVHKEKEVMDMINRYAKMSQNNRSDVIYCFDCDDYDTKPEDADFIKKAEEFCRKRNYSFIWFCKDIESVFLGRKVPDNRKASESIKFKNYNLIDHVSANELSATAFRSNTSNILSVLDGIPELIRK